MVRSDAARVAQFVRRCTRTTGEVEARRSLFEAVRDLPYGTDAATDAVALLQQGRGNGLAKADVLQRGFALLGY